ncbi:hypothetical protein R1sor_017498 [Riccia sorocarpa]|uniref:Ubiquitin-like protease family profile domain-containing protein n=1 Tax=Riccia sorocarpa TaxID=122646 RepID=A0ABD3IB06_9MARC
MPAHGARSGARPISHLSGTSWVQQPVYKTDFGWGTPLFVGPPAAPLDVVILVPSYTQDGSIDVVTTLSASDMERVRFHWRNPSEILPSEVVEIGDSPASGRDTRDPLDDWKSYEQLTKKDLESTNPKRFIRGDVINMYIKEKFLVQPRSELESKFFVNTFWFAQLNALNKQILSGNLAGSVEKIHRLRKGITPRVDDVQDIRTLFVPIHFGKGDFHWSLAVVHFGTSRCIIYHLDSALGTHNTTDVCAVLSLFVTIALKIPLEKISVGSYFTPQQRGNHECGYHVMHFLSEVAKMKGDLGPYFDDESACRFANVGDVDSFQLIFGMYMDPKGWTAKNLKRRVLP